MLQQLIQFDPQWQYSNTKTILPSSDLMAKLASKQAVRYYFTAYHKTNDFNVRAKIVEQANKITTTIPPVQCNRLRLELEMSGGMSNDHRIFPFHIGSKHIP